jgi:lipopolysaccharide export system permease protein
MINLYRMLFRAFVPMFVVALLFFVLILQIVDIFAYIWRYIQLGVPFAEIALVQLYYLPKCVAYALSPSLLFAVAFTLGTLYANNELIAVFAAGVSLYRLIVPLLVFGVLLSFGSFFFEEEVVIDTFRTKNALSEDLLRQRKSLSNTNVTVIDSERDIIYHADYYNDAAKSLRNLIIIERNDEGDVIRRIDAEQGVWNESEWELQRAREFIREEEGDFVERFTERLIDPQIIEPPQTFRRIVYSIDEMHIAEAREWIESLRRAGLPYREQLTDFYKRFSFALTPFIVALISCAVGGRFKKNILLMSLLLSLVISVLYYVGQMVTGILAKFGLFTPIMGAWTAVIAFFIASVLLFRTAKT